MFFFFDECESMGWARDDATKLGCICIVQNYVEHKFEQYNLTNTFKITLKIVTIYELSSKVYKSLWDANVCVSLLPSTKAMGRGREREREICLLVYIQRCFTSCTDVKFIILFEELKTCTTYIRNTLCSSILMVLHMHKTNNKFV